MLLWRRGAGWGGGKGVRNNVKKNGSGAREKGGDTN